MLVDAFKQSQKNIPSQKGTSSIQSQNAKRSQEASFLSDNEQNQPVTNSDDECDRSDSRTDDVSSNRGKRKKWTTRIISMSV